MVSTSVMDGRTDGPTDRHALFKKCENASKKARVLCFVEVSSHLLFFILLFVKNKRSDLALLLKLHIASKLNAVD